MPIIEAGKPVMMQCIAPCVDVRVAPSESAPLDTQILFGELVEHIDTEGEHVKIRMRRDGKVGWIQPPTGLFVPEHDSFQPTHRVTARQTPGYAEPNFKSRDVIQFPFNAQVRSLHAVKFGSLEYACVSLPSGGVWVSVHHLSPLGSPAELSRDPASEALKFLHTPYLWGGVSSIRGIDCSALIQQSLWACGIDCPRDSKPQSEVVGKLADSVIGSKFRFQRNDLVFWKGHVAIMITNRRCVHATMRSPHSKVVMQGIAEVRRERRRAGEGEIIAVRRLPPNLYGGC